MPFAQVDGWTNIDVHEGIFFAFLVGAVAYFLWMLYILYSCYRRLPPVYRELQPWQVWLVLIPCAGWFFGFFVFPNLSRSFQNYFKKHPRTDVGNCGHQLSLWVAWTFVLGTLPLGGVGVIAASLFMVLLLLFVLQVTELKKLVPADASERERADEAAQKKPAAKSTSKWRDNRADSWHATKPGEAAPPVDPAASDEIALDLSSLTTALAQPGIEPTPVPPPEETKPADDADVDESPK